ncbi:hypothetical protein H0H92_012334 [Tricholoma furcatifolium]|nr:hypothetical protein H0H92_012334 [Tricholoma furcatifolium]
MDVNGWSAQRRAHKEDELLSVRRPDGRHSVAEDISPLHEQFIGGFQVPRPHPPAGPSQLQFNQPSYPHAAQPPSPQPPALPPKDQLYTQPSFQPGLPIQTQPPSQMPQPSQFSGYQYQPGYHYQPATQSSITTAELTRLSAVERSETLRVARMTPHLQFMVGPLLRYDTVDEYGVWHGAAMIVTADAGSIYEPHPTLTYDWDPDQTFSNNHVQPTRSFDLGPHPADPHSTFFAAPMSPAPNGNGSYTMQGSNARQEIVPGQEIYVYGGPGGTFTFWRFLIQIPLGPREMNCNGFSAGVNQDDFCGPGFKSGYDPVWMDLLAKHAETPFHALVGGGDQLYCDSLMRETEMQDWIARKPEEKLHFPLTDEIASTIDRFYFNHYCQSFRRGAFARANSSIPMMNMCDDHGLFFQLFPVQIEPDNDLAGVPQTLPG